MNNCLVTGGAGFIGSHFVNTILSYTDANVIVLDKLTYAGDINRLSHYFNNPRFNFIQGDIVSENLVTEILKKYAINQIINFAAETHVDRSIFSAEAFIHTNINGTFNLLRCAQKQWSKECSQYRFLQISTDEVFGDIPDDGSLSIETDPYNPRNPYAATKASADHLVKSWFETYGFPINISYCANNFGPNQHKEKLIPLAIYNAIHRKDIPIYGNGKQKRDWLYVKDHCAALLKILENAPAGSVYNISSQNEWENIKLIRKIADLIDIYLERMQGETEKLIKFVPDRKGHDKRYALDSSKITQELKWQCANKFEDTLKNTIEYYLEIFSEWKKNK